MEFARLSFLAGLAEYEEQAGHLLAAQRKADPAALDIFHRNHPRFLDETVVWLPKDVSEAEIAESPLDLNDARLALARWYSFLDWEALTGYSHAVTSHESPVYWFETAVEAVIGGDCSALSDLLSSHPDLVTARSSRVTNFDPPVHGATLLHYIAANGVEGYRQRTPKTAVEIAGILLAAGAEPDATADMYGEPCTTMSMLVSSSPPADAGLQIALMNVLIDSGASVEAQGGAKWGSPLMTALTFEFADAAQALLRRGARMDTIAAAAGLGMLDEARRLLPDSGSESRHKALALAAQHGHVEVVRLLLDAGEDPNRYNPEDHHKHATPLHQAVLAGHEDVVRLLVSRGARSDIKDTIWKSTALGWAIHFGRTNIETILRGEQINS